ncbi:MAG: glycosyltransferase [Desulfovibrionales bacterium]|nr:glycosyltransferase [Desulfovibrionales bacterium]
MENKLSICIIGKDQEGLLGECIDSALKLSRRAIYLDLGSTDKSVDLAEQKGLEVVKSEPSLTEAQESLERWCNSEWILFLKAGEKVILQSDALIDKILGNGPAQGYSLIVKDVVEPDVLEDYRWIKISGQYKYSKGSRYVSKVEIRLVRRQYFAKILKLMMTWSKEDLFSFNSQILREVQIYPCQRNEESKEDSPAEARELEMKYLKGEILFDPAEEDSLWELGDTYITYAVLTKKDLNRYYKGLSAGFGGERMYLTLLHNLGRFGRYAEARDFFEAWKNTWEFFDTPEPYRIGGIIYAHLFDTDKAIQCLEKYVESVSEDRLGEPLSLLGKTYLLHGNKEKAVSLLKRSRELRYDKFDAMVIDCIDKDGWEPPRLSVCMIARDEGPNIRKALDSVSGIADEIIVVDTGSTDNTKEIVREFKGKIIESPWEDDFSKVRNIGLREATGAYILCLDADEFIDARDRIKLALVKQILPVGRDTAFCIKVEWEDKEEEMTVMLRLPQMNQPYYLTRLFPNHPEIHFEGRAFEGVDSSIGALGIKIERNDLFKITHSRCDRELRDRRKKIAVRNAFEFISDPETALRGILYFLRLGDLDAALKWLDKTSMDNPQLLARIVELYSTVGKANSVAGLINKAIDKFPESMELNLAKAELDLAGGKYEEVCNILEPRLGNIKEAMSRADWARACYLYGMALLETGDLGRGLECLSDAREADPWNIRYKTGGIYALARCEEWEGAIGAVGDVLRGENLDPGGIIGDFADLGLVLAKLSRHFADTNRGEMAALCRKVMEEIIQYKISNKTELEKMSGYLNAVGFGGDVNA